MIGRVSDDAVQAAVLPTLRAVYAADGGAWARATVAQLAGLLQHVATRSPAADRTGELAAALARLDSNALVPADGDPYDRASMALADAAGRDDEDARAVRAALRPLLLAELDDELAVTSPLLDAFRGRLPDA